ncbi:MAG: rhomboid family intramembrane serine protease [Proteobacteria bacterium]|nr:rhomboid family intramembrane serine protease [Pseudomonadota bacterium]
MNQDIYKTRFRITPNLTETGKRLMVLFSLIYILELIVEHWFHFPVVELLQLYPFEDERFMAFQFFTHPFIQHPASPFNFLLSLLLFYFFAGPVERSIGTKRFLPFFFIAIYGGALCGLCFSNIDGFNLPFLGLMPGLLATLVVFGLLSPESMILLFFILPVKAKFISYGTILIVFLGFLSKTSPGATYQLGGILLGYLYFNGFKNTLESNRLYLNYIYRQQQRKKSRFKVIDGEKNDKGDKPTYH